LLWPGRGAKEQSAVQEVEVDLASFSTIQDERQEWQEDFFGGALLRAEQEELEVSDLDGQADRQLPVVVFSDFSEDSVLQSGQQRHPQLLPKTVTVKKQNIII